MGPVVFHTERLRLRSWTTEDIPAIVGLFADPEVSRFINDGRPVTPEQAERFVIRYERVQRERGWCRWALELECEPGIVAGFCGVGCTFAPEIELGWTLRRDLWSNGYATEAATGALRYCFETVGFDRVISAIDPDNTRSIAVARRLGMQESGHISLDEHSLLRYAIDNPTAEPSAQPGMIADCEGEPKGSSFTSEPEL